jgi:cytochrome P450
VLREIADLPGPRGLPLVGSLLQVRRTRMHQIVERWAAMYGPVFRFDIAGAHVLVVADHQALTAALRARPDEFRRPDRMVTIGTEMGLEVGLFAAEGHDWRRQRRMIVPAFDAAHVERYYRVLLRVSARLEQRWGAAADDDRPIDLRAELTRFTVDAVSALAFGVDVNTLESPDDALQRDLDCIFSTLSNRMLSPIPYWRYLPLPHNRRLARSVHAVHRAIDALVTQARRRMADIPARRLNPDNLLDAMISATGDDGELSDAEIAGNILTILLAGEDTTANTLSWMIFLLRAHPAALERARAEVRTVFGPEAPLTFDALARLEYVEACTSEAMRLKPAAPVIGLQALRETSIAGIRVPAGTLIWGVMRHDSMSAAYFQSPTAFIPERWLGGASFSVDAAAKRTTLPFGAGPRVCPGRHLALVEMKTVMAMLLRRFEIDSVFTDDGQPPRERLAFTMAPVGLRMRLRRV